MTAKIVLAMSFCLMISGRLSPASAEEPASDVSKVIAPRVRIIVDNDFGGDPDGLFQLAHHLLSPTVEVRGVIGSQHYPNGFYGSSGTATHACEKAKELLSVMGLAQRITVAEGANAKLRDGTVPEKTAGSRLIVDEAMDAEAKMPLYVVCGPGLTNIASAYLTEPRIAEHLTLVWIGGPEYQGQALPPPGNHQREYNLGIDVIAGQVVFNDSNLAIWQVPRNAYRQTLVSYAELQNRLHGTGPTADYLRANLDQLLGRTKRTLGEAYAFGDSPLVLLTALQSAWDPDASSSEYVVLPAPTITPAGQYESNPMGRNIRVYTRLDVRLMLEDFYAKMAAAGRRDH